MVFKVTVLHPPDKVSLFVRGLKGYFFCLRYTVTYSLIGFPSASFMESAKLTHDSNEYWLFAMIISRSVIRRAGPMAPLVNAESKAASTLM